MTTSDFSHELIGKANEINDYTRGREGDYVIRKVSLMLGRLASRYEGMPVFVSANIAAVPDESGVRAAMAEITGSIKGFSFDHYPTNMLEENEPKGGVMLNILTPIFNGVEVRDAEDWRLNVLPPELRNGSIDGFVVGIPLIDGQNILQIGDKPEELTTEALTESPESSKQYSYREYVEKVNYLTGQRPTLDGKLDAPRLRAIDEIMQSMVFKCPFIGEIVAIESEYIRSPKPNKEEGYKVLQGSISGVLRKFNLEMFQDYRTKQWKSDVHAVVYTEQVAHMVQIGEMTPETADSLPSTYFIPLSETHTLVTNTGLKN